MSRATSHMPVPRRITAAGRNVRWPRNSASRANGPRGKSVFALSARRPKSWVTKAPPTQTTRRGCGWRSASRRASARPRFHRARRTASAARRRWWLGRDLLALAREADQLCEEADHQRVGAARLELLAVADDLVRGRHGDLAVDDARADRGQDLAGLRLSPDRPEHAGARAHHGDRLVAQGAGRVGPGHPVERVLQVPGNRMVVLRRRDQDRIDGADLLAQPVDLLGRVALVVLVERRDVAQPVVNLELDSGRQQRRRRPEQLGVVRVAAQGPADAENSHRGYALASSSSTTSVTSLESATPPLGSGAFQLRP